MGKRNKAVLIRLTEWEHTYLKKQSSNAGMKMEPYVRNLIMGNKVKPYPPDAYRGLLRELSAIGNNINQIAHIANAQQNISSEKNFEAIRLVGEAMRIVREAF